MRLRPVLAGAAALVHPVALRLIEQQTLNKYITIQFRETPDVTTKPNCYDLTNTLVQPEPAKRLEVSRTALRLIGVRISSISTITLIALLLVLVLLFVDVFIYIYICIHTYIHTYIHIYIYIYLYIVMYLFFVWSARAFIMVSNIMTNNDNNRIHKNKYYYYYHNSIIVIIIVKISVAPRLLDFGGVNPALDPLVADKWGQH